MKLGKLILIFAILVILFSSFIIGISSGKESGKEKANSEIRTTYTAKINSLKSELDYIINHNENKIATMNTNHSNTITNLTNNHKALISSMEKNHIDNKEKTKNDSYAEGYIFMTSRIHEVINLDVKNIPIKEDWNATVYTNKR